jgi:hypothetical protein
MHVLYALVRFFPYWALPVALIVAELGRFYRRRQSQNQYWCWTASVALIVFTVFWFVLRGDQNSDNWVRALTAGG